MIPGTNGYKFGEGIGFGIMYERKINPYFSVLGGGTFTTNFNDDISYIYIMNKFPLLLALAIFFASSASAENGNIYFLL
jgi:hypothetical protein